MTYVRKLRSESRLEQESWVVGHGVPVSVKSRPGVDFAEKGRVKADQEPHPRPKRA